MLFLPESPKFLYSKGKIEESLTILKKIYLINTGTTYSNELIAPRDTYVVDVDQKSKLSQIGDQIKELFAKETILQTLNFCFVAFAITFAGFGVYMWLPITISFYMVDSNGAKDICSVIKISQSGNSSSTDGDCDAPVDTSQFLILVYVGCCFTFFYLFISQIIIFVGKKRVFSKFMHFIYMLIIERNLI